MVAAIPEFVGGLVLAMATVRDVFDTVVVPGGSHASLSVARRLAWVSLPLWRMFGRNRSVPSSFAPFVLLSSFVVWMLLLILGFGLMVHALGGDLKPAPSYGDALYVAGGALVTVGFGNHEVGGVLRFVLLAGAFSGLAVMTMAVTYLLEMQGGIAERDAGILKLSTATGDPPSGLGLLERYAAIQFKDHIPEIMQDGRDWCAKVLQSHASHPTLIYFRGKETGCGWPAALGALMDLTLIIELLLDVPEWRPLAVLLREHGDRMSEALIETVGLEPQPMAITGEEVDALLRRLDGAGYPLSAWPKRDAFCKARSERAARLCAMAAHLGTLQAPLLPRTTPVESRLG